MAINLFTKTNEKTKSGAGTTLNTSGTVSLNNNVNLFNIGKTNTNKTSTVLNNASSNKGIVTNKLSYDILKGMQNGTIDRNNLFNSIETARKNYIEEPLARQRATVDYLQSEDFANTKRTSNWTGDPSVDYYMHPQNMTPEGWIDRKLALDKGDTVKAKQIEEQDRAKRVQNWNNWWNSEEQVKKRQERTDKYNKEQEKKQKEYEARKPESQKYVQEFINTTNENGKDYVRGLLSKGIGVNELADKVKSYEYVQGFINNTQDGWWANYSQYDGLKDDLRYMLSTGEYSVDDLAKHIKDTTGYELPAKDWKEAIGKGVFSVPKNFWKGALKVGDSTINSWNLAYTAGKNAITGSNDKYRKVNSWKEFESMVNGDMYRPEYKEANLGEYTSNALNATSGYVTSLLEWYAPVFEGVMGTVNETQWGRDFMSNPNSGTVLGGILGTVLTKGRGAGWLKTAGGGAGGMVLGTMPKWVDEAVEEKAEGWSEEDKENLKTTITNGIFVGLLAGSKGTKFEPVKSMKNTVKSVKDLPKTVENIKDSRVAKKAENASEQAIVGKEMTKEQVGNAMSSFTKQETKGIKTYEQWTNKLNEKIKTVSREVDNMLSKDKVYELKDFNQTTKSGKTDINYIKDALEDLKDFYTKNKSYEKLEKVESFLNGEKMSELDINNISRELSQESNAWLKNGNLSKSKTKEGYEATRMGIKKWLRENTEGGMKAEKLDAELTDMYSLRNITETRAGNAIRDQIRNKESLGGKIVRGGFTVAGTVAGTALAPGYGSIGGVILGKIIGNALTNVGKKTGRSDFDMQKSLNKHLRTLQKYGEQLEKKKMTKKQVETAIEDLLSSEKKRSKFLKKKTKTEAKKLSEPKVKGLLTEGKKALPEGKKLLKSGEKNVGEGKKVEAKPLKKSEEKVEKKVVNEKKVETKEEKTKSVLKNAPKTNSKGEDIERFTSKTDEALKKRKKDIESYFNRANENITRLLEKYPELEKNIEKKNQILNKADKDAVDQIIANFTKNTPKEESLLISKEGLKSALGEYRLLENEFKRRGLDFTDEFSNLLKKPKKLEAKKLEKPKKESEVKNKWDELRETQSKLNQATYILEKYKSNENLDFNMIEKIDAFYDILHNTKMDNRYIDGKKTSDAEIYKEIAKVYNETNGNYEKINPKDRLEILEDILEKEIEHYEYKKNKEVSEKDFPDLMELIEDAKKDIKTLEEAKKEVKPLKKGKVLNEKIKNDTVYVKVKDTENKKSASTGIEPRLADYTDIISDFQKKANKFTKIGKNGVAYYEKVDGTNVEYKNYKDFPKRKFIKESFRSDVEFDLKDGSKNKVKIVDDIQIGKETKGNIAELPSWIFKDGKSRFLELTTEVYEKIFKRHGPFSNNNLIATATDFDYALKNIGGFSDRYNLIKTIPGTNRGLVLGFKRVNGASVVTHFESKANIKQYISELNGRGAKQIEMEIEDLPF